jgi:hypothetical protein
LQVLAARVERGEAVPQMNGLQLLDL